MIREISGRVKVVGILASPSLHLATSVTRLQELARLLEECDALMVMALRALHDRVCAARYEESQRHLAGFTEEYEFEKALNALHTYTSKWVIAL